ncbi:hypothetical protein C7974DRAFT_90489 [Boeremia exigua]|uniref:uncharacterized protein n=1 Tax=Boeremia exigua TaxID=749465 RepID=UPI001E8D7F19|nr:uncharacterized protein C7974DRAFT_90489 [Boeremia exigua]KAH6612050.1 hypothetical protein C7974DRAFT_90489 [Boeremia exigua]
MLASLLAVAVVAAATPFTSPQNWILREAQFYTLRANCPDQPWHGRSLVNLPLSKRLGLENFTVNPETPALKFLPIRIHNEDNKYALRGYGVGDDLSRTPYLAALTNNATRTVSLKIVYLPTPLRESFKTQTDACPEDYDCTADQWTFDDPSRLSSSAQFYRDLRFGGFKGRWEPFKDAGKEGWHVYWKGNAGIHHPVQFDLVPTTQGNSASH